MKKMIVICIFLCLFSLISAEVFNVSLSFGSEKNTFYFLDHLNDNGDKIFGMVRGDAIISEDFRLFGVFETQMLIDPQIIPYNWATHISIGGIANLGLFSFTAEYKHMFYDAGSYGSVNGGRIRSFITLLPSGYER